MLYSLVHPRKEVNFGIKYPFSFYLKTSSVTWRKGNINHTLLSGSFYMKRKNLVVGFIFNSFYRFFQLVLENWNDFPSDYWWVYWGTLFWSLNDYVYLVCKIIFGCHRTGTWSVFSCRHSTMWVNLTWSITCCHSYGRGSSWKLQWGVLNLPLWLLLFLVCPRESHYY